MFPAARTFTLIAQYWLVTGMDLSVIGINRIACSSIEKKIKINDSHIDVFIELTRLNSRYLLYSRAL